MEPDELLKQATAKKKAGDLESAIELLRKAYKEINKSSIVYPVKTFLRLPTYLQEMGRSSCGIFLVLSDLFSRSILDRIIPLGIITGLIGGIFFLYLLASRRGIT